MKIIWCMVPEIWSVMDKIFVTLDRFLHFYPLKTQKIKILKKWKKKSGDIIILHMCTRNNNHMLYYSWDVKCGEQNFLSFWTVFCHFNPKNQDLEKIKKKPGDIIILHKCTINDNQMMYGFWYIEHNRQISLPFWTIFCPLPP